MTRAMPNAKTKVTSSVVILLDSAAHDVAGKPKL